ncbi:MULTISPECIES: amino acid ABC transporter substrate-binding protein [Vibrio]|uniref:Amino acid ABC transporter substrate-binding protein n=1 Tax=Vibrio natriegens NBRC 15636 = ATCC 14048 = DSM 759 TaxID=1219067 RepID=A0AAN1CWT5_VIBNA|nr:MULTISPECIES: amino acid ABC transporter substrate-binding protein [Vibrio]MEE3880559.1 amino acid ABC transporter substrate-binding protein [Vibrio sp. YYF0003]AEX20510.1 amino acid ABC transporter substrate-binding protein [Vibrio sp. EJY3]ALR16888.1 amino acid ABC transporter substrate-binding protein [Vibrio natriegens NBRC 15636 = ATCC 14048 = DSM 759]ANQ13939.1 amino acid ABC transporter substrate-binding protein [Vibrio natriegens NBRC 15636 = ATCC 14048 = DSM 759]ANQ18434.1 amino ac
MKNWIKVAVAAIALSAATVQAATEVKVGMSGRYFPFTFVKQDKLQGFEVDMWDEIGKRNDYKIEYVTANFSGLFGLLETGRIDTISNQITMTEERKAKYLFADPYVVDGAQITVRKGNDSIKGIDDLAGKTVAVNLGSNFEQLLRKYDKDGKINIKTYDTGIEHDVALGRSDAFVMDRLSALELIKKTGLPLELAGEPFETIQNAWPFVNNEKGQKLQAEVNKALAEMRADGTVEKISVKWFGADITK